MVATPDFGGVRPINDSDPLTGSEQSAGDSLSFSVFPHLHREDDIPATPLAEIEAWAARLSVPAYAIDDQTRHRWPTAPSKSLSEGHWKLSNPAGSKLVGSRNADARLGQRSEMSWRRSWHG